MYALILTFSYRKNSLGYEIGCSSGTLINKLLEWNKNKSLKLVGIDSEAGMINYCKNKIDDKRVKFFNDDVVNYEFEKSNLIISYYTMQFIHPSSRQNVFNKIYNSLEWGGAFIFLKK